MRDKFLWNSGYGAANPERLSQSGMIKILCRAVIEQGVRGKPITRTDETARSFQSYACIRKVLRK
jgi:hypothetical protein